MNEYSDFNKYTSEVDFIPIINFILQQGNLRHYSKGDYFVQINGRSNSMGYVTSGAFRYNSISANGESKIVGYSFKNGFVGNYPTFLHKISSSIEIQAVCDSSVYVISNDEINKFYKSDTANQELRAKIAEALLLEVYDRLVSIYTMSPKEQYLEILNRCPDLLNMITLKELSSYLMTTPETLSRIRKEIVSK